MDHHEILDAHTKFARQIDARLYRDHVALCHHCLRCRRSIGVLVNLHAHAVSQRMPEVIAIAGVSDDLSCAGIHVPAGHASLGEPQRFLLCPKYHAVHLTHPLCGLSHADGTGHVAVIAVYHCTVIHHHNVAVQNDSLRRGNAVRHRSPCTGECDGGE